MDEDSVSLSTYVERNQQGRMMWYFNDILIAAITGDHSKICTDDECGEIQRWTEVGSSDWISDHQKHHNHRLWKLYTNDPQQQIQHH